MADPGVLRVAGEPPNFAEVKGDRKKLGLYISALKRWSRVGGVPKKDQADTIIYHAHRTCNEYFEELESKFGTTLDESEEGTQKIIEYLEEKNGLSKHSEIVRIFNVFLNTKREKNENLVNFVQRFEKAYTDVQNLTTADQPKVMTMSATGKSIMMLVAAKLPDIDYQIITKGLDFDEKDKEKEKKVFDLTKKAMVDYQVTKMSNNQSDPAQGAAKPVYFSDVLEQEGEEFQEMVKTYFANKNTGTKQAPFKKKAAESSKRGRFWKCEYCICDIHKKWLPCDCPCSKHETKNCPNPDPEKKKAALERKRRRQDGAGSSQPSQLTQKESTTTTELYTYMAGLSKVPGDPSGIFVVKRASDSTQPRSLEEFNKILGEDDSEGSDDPDLPSTAGIRQCDKPASPPRVYLRSQSRSRQVPQGSGEDAVERVYIAFKEVSSDKTPRPLTDFIEATSATVLNTNDGIAKNPAQFSMIVDTAAPATIIGQDRFITIRDSYPPAVRKSFEICESYRNFEFGGGEKTHSLAKVRLPLYIMDYADNVHQVHVWVEVVNQKGVPFLLGGASLETARAQINLGEQSNITFNWEDEIKIPLYKANSGHFHILFITMSEDDDRDVIKRVVQRAEWDNQEISQLVNYTLEQNSTESLVEAIRRPPGQMKVFLAKAGQTKAKTPLGKEEINRLHHYWGHIHPDKLKDLVMKSGRYDDNTLQFIKDLKNCQPCKVEARRPPRPKSTAPKATSFNHLICIDLKENIRYKNAPPYILYIIDAFTKFKAAKFIKDKKGETVTEALMLEWVKYFGPPKYIQSDRGKEFLNKHLQAFCSVHGIRMTTTASFTPNANGLIERGHATVDKMMEKMVTADSRETPHMALCWSIQAANSMELVEGVSPYTLVFGRNPTHPVLSDPGEVECLEDVSTRLAQQFQVMMRAREVYAAVEADQAIQKALKARLFTDHTNINVNDWIYYRTNIDRYWKGPLKVVMKDGKRLYCIKHGNPVTINVDDVLMVKQGDEEAQMLEKFTMLRADQVQTEPIQSPDKTTIPVTDHIPTAEENIQPDQTPDHVPVISAKTSTAQLDIGVPVICKICEEEFSSKVIAQHGREEHNTGNKSVRSFSSLTDPKPDSLYANIDRIKSGDVMVEEGGRYLVLEHQEEDDWTAHDLITKEKEKLSVIKQMTKMRYIGQLEEETEEEIRVSKGGQVVHYNKDSFKQKIFFTSRQEEVQGQVFVVNIPRSRHGEKECLVAKSKELADFEHFDVYEEVDQAEYDNDNVISTEWVLVEKEKTDGTKVIKARLCMRGDQERNKHNIPADSPTANKITIRILLALAVSKGWTVTASDVRRAFLQTQDIERQVLVKPPPEAGVQKGKLWLLKRACYGLIDASRAYFLRHARQLNKFGFAPLEFDPATFVWKENDEIKAVYAAHVDDCLVTGEREAVKTAQEKMAEKFDYGEIQQLPIRFLGINISKDQEGDITLDQEHYVKDLQVPDMDEIKSLNKLDILPEKFQSIFRSLASKINMLALSSRPDFAFAAKYLTSRYGKAVKSDLSRVVKLINKAREEPSIVAVPNIGQIEEWTIVAISDASTKKYNNIFAVGGYVVMLVNKITGAAVTLLWSSKKIDRVVNSSLAAETLALQKMTGKIFLIRKLLEGLLGEKAKRIPCIALIDSQNLWSCIHNLKACNDDRLQADIISIRQAIHDDHSIQEVRFVPTWEMLADSLTKQTTLLDNNLLNTVRAGHYELPGGHQVRDSTRTSVKTWAQLIRAEQEDEQSQLHSP